LRGTHNLVNLYANTERRVESITPADAAKCGASGISVSFVTSSARACGRVLRQRWRRWAAVCHTPKSPARRPERLFRGTLAA
jgi:hypothetical protein